MSDKPTMHPMPTLERVETFIRKAVEKPPKECPPIMISSSESSPKGWWTYVDSSLGWQLGLNPLVDDRAFGMFQEAVNKKLERCDISISFSLMTKAFKVSVRIYIRNLKHKSNGYLNPPPIDCFSMHKEIRPAMRYAFVEAALQCEDI